MKVFEVITEHENVDKEIVMATQYVTAKDDSLLSVVDYFTRYCYECEEELKSVREVLTIVQNIESSEIAEKAGKQHLEDKEQSE